jgi:hypothetical protein
LAREELGEKRGAQPPTLEFAWSISATAANHSK